MSQPSSRYMALRQWIEQLSDGQHLYQSATEKVSHGEQSAALLYMGNVHDAVPRCLLYDPLLSCVDVVTWQAIRIYADQNNASPFPKYEDLLAIVKVSRPTLGRAIGTLQLVRWLSVIPVMKRDQRGRIAFQGRIYALHDERLSVSDAIFIDPKYSAVVERGCCHPYKPFSSVAKIIWEEVIREKNIASAPMGDLHEGLDARSEGEQFTWIKNFNAGGIIQEKSPDDDFEAEVKYFYLGNDVRDKNILPGGTDSKKFNSGRVNVVGSGKDKYINNINTTNTTTTKENRAAGLSQDRAVFDSDQLLEWPDPLLEFLHNDENLIHVVSAQLKPLEKKLAQLVLDEATGSLSAKLRRLETIDNPVGYLLALAKRAQNGSFIPTQNSVAGRAMRYAAQPVSFSNVLQGESGNALQYAWTGRIADPLEPYTILDRNGRSVASGNTEE